MKKNHRVFLFSIPVILALLFSTLEAIPVSAEDVTPPTDPIVETVDSAPADPTEEAALSETNSTDPTEVAVSEDAAPTEAPAEEVTDVAPIVQEESMDTLPEILAAVPDGTEIVVLDENGEAQSMTSQEAAETLVQGDPVWCPGSQVPTPGANGCTNAHTSFSDLIAELSAGSFSLDGTIWVAYNYDKTQDNNQIRFNGSAVYDAVNNPHPLNNLTSLTINGGWDGVSGSSNITGVSEIDVPMSIFNWLGSVTLQNLLIANTTDTTGFGLHVDTDSALFLNNVSANGSTGTNDGALLYGDAAVMVNNSHFDNNGGFGVMAWSTNGDIVITDSTASNNARTGAYLNTCNYSGGVCTSTGSVNLIGANTFSGNGMDGLNITAGGSAIVMGGASPSAGNIMQNNGLSGAIINSGTSGSGSSVVVTNTSLLGNGNGTGLRINQYGDGNITLTSLIATGNDTGVFVNNTFGTGSIDINTGQFNKNDYTGIHVESTGNITLTNSIAGSVVYGENGGTGGNGANGAYLISDGNITVENSFFNENVKSASPADPGLYAKAGNLLQVINVSANGNVFGPGAVLLSSGASQLIVSNSHFNQNGTFGLQTDKSGGDTIISSTEANGNAVKGAYLTGHDASNIFINDCDFIENGSYGVYGSTESGNIEMNISTLDGNNVTSYGAKLIATDGGNITINSGAFTNHTVSGLYLVGNGTITLNGVQSTNNVKTNSAAYSTFTAKGCFCPGDTPSSVQVTVNGGDFSNSETGIYAKPGTEGDLIFTGTQTYTGTTTPFVLDTDEIPMCSDCGCGSAEKPEGKPYQVIEVPFSGSGSVPQQCSIYAGTVLQMENGINVKVGCPFNGSSNLQGLNEADLPGLLGTGADFDLAILLGLLGEDGTAVLNSDGTITITFTIPETTRGQSHRLLFWDTSLNGGEGGWHEMPPYEFGTSFPLHPEDPSDPRLIVNGVSQNGNTMSITVNFGGTFVVVSN